ncbi:MAG: PBSX family phage terminase large subunit [Proteobacteria bacterium]|nr:PBSX family phage terminase large subunit [Pseudomonadota bacterium]
MQTVQLPATYYHVKECKSKIQIHQGGTRSGKTYSILTALIELCHKNSGLVITICRKTFPALRATAMRDFFEILNNEDIYNPDLHNKSDATYQLWGNMVEFISIDQPQKVRGRKRDVLFINEANEINLEDWRQLLLRTTGRVLIDYNPSDEFHWIYEEVIPREDAEFFRTTYKDNPFLPKSVVMEIERFKTADENFWKVYGLGERGTSQATIFTHWKEINQIPNEFKLLTTGVDFGYTNDPTAIVRVYTDGHGFAVDEICYATRLTNSDISKVLRDNQVDRSDVVICDSAEPKSIDEIHAYGFNTHGARKGKDSVKNGIQFLHSRPLLVTARSVNLIRELRNYKWKEDKNGKQLNEPVDKFNHAIDAMRYAITFNQTNPNFGSYAIG